MSPFEAAASLSSAAQDVKQYTGVRLNILGIDFLDKPETCSFISDQKNFSILLFLHQKELLPLFQK
ncbi:MAG TPA: hypothetical protein H9894_00645 [Candidatus Desulfovibrio intestinipullorum]|uniref:Uncharacterized protein n=1 Tax=Candidatus Desulfovibrio intestinipullorum TaxID=2838536 RepID=A0A9D1PU90_9BACT|nr:hypothetical protein [Candidatus Desulfovibrio intestinipullorum]